MCFARAGPCTQTCCAFSPWSASGPSRLAAQCRGDGMLHAALARTDCRLPCAAVPDASVHRPSAFSRPPRHAYRSTGRPSLRQSEANLPRSWSLVAKVGTTGMVCTCQNDLVQCMLRPHLQFLMSVQASGDVDPAMVRDLARLMPDPAGSDDLLAPGAL